MVRTPALVIANCVQIKLGFTVANQGCFNILHARKATTLTVDQTLANSVGSAIKSAWTTNIAPLSAANAALIRVSVRDLTNPNQPELFDTSAIAAGNGTGDLLPPQVAACVTLKTPLAGKSFRGRVYVNGFNEAQSDAFGTIVTAANQAAVNFITAIRTALTPLQLTLCVASRPAFGSITTKVTTFNDGTTESHVVSRINAKPGGTSDVNLIQARNAAWESQRKRSNARGGVPTSLAVFEQHV